jgi:frataxin-like iron-binding protein CyaY
MVAVAVVATVGSTVGGKKFNLSNQGWSQRRKIL